MLYTGNYYSKCTVCKISVIVSWVNGNKNWNTQETLTHEWCGDIYALGEACLLLFMLTNITLKAYKQYTLSNDI